VSDQIVTRHQEEVLLNLERWRRKPLLHEIYRDFQKTIATYIAPDLAGEIVEIGSGIGSIRDVIPRCIRTDLCPNPWIDRVENAYSLSFGEKTVSHLILFDVFHHLQYPGSALAEFRRVLVPRGRVIVFDPCISLLGLLVYGAAHPEPVALFRRVEWMAPGGWSPEAAAYFAAAANATKVFGLSRYRDGLKGWTLLERRRMAAFSYVASGGYSGPQLYPARWLPAMRRVDRALDLLPWLFATRLIAVLERSGDEP
jgi:Methyltransferase domain